MKWKNPNKESDVLTLEDLLSAMNKLEEQSITPDYIVMHPRDLADLKKSINHERS